MKPTLTEGSVSPQTSKNKMSSLAIKQLIATLEEQNSSDPAVRLQLNKLYKQRDSEQKAAADKKQQEQEQEQPAKKQKQKQKQNKQQVVQPEGRTIACCDCSAEFFFTQKEEALFTESGWSARKRCNACVEIKKQNQLQPISLECTDCDGKFIFGVGAQKEFTALGFAQPTRCAPCRAVKKQLQQQQKKQPLSLSCCDCKGSFIFSVGAQHHFAEQKWVAPKRCPPCRATAAATASAITVGTVNVPLTTGDITLSELITAGAIAGEALYNPDTFGQTNPDTL